MKLLRVIAFTICIILVLFGVTNGQKNRSILENYKSSICEPITPYRELNIEWVKGVERWYLTAWDKNLYDYFLSYMVGNEIYTKMNDKEKSQSCMTLSSFANHTDTFASYGGNNQINLSPVFNPIRPGVIDWQINNKDYICTTYILLSDNTSYFLGLDFFPDGVKGVWAASIEKTLTSSATSQILEKMTELGLSKDTFYKPDFTNC